MVARKQESCEDSRESCTRKETRLRPPTIAAPPLARAFSRASLHSLQQTRSQVLSPTRREVTDRREPWERGCRHKWRACSQDSCITAG